MKLVRAAAVLVGLLDFGLGLWFLTSPGSFSGAEGHFECARGVGVCCLASAALLLIVASDPERYFPVMFVIAGGHALAALVGIPAVIHGGPQLAVVVSAAALAAVLIAAIVYAVRRRREEMGTAKPKPEAKADTKKTAKKKDASKGKAKKA